MTWPEEIAHEPPLPHPVPDDAPVVLEVEDLTVTYPDGTVALSEVNLRLQKGERLGIIGPNGAGKSTLLLALADLVPLQKGTVRFPNLEHRPAPGDHLGILFQNPDDQLFCMTTFDDIAFGPRNQGLTEEEVERRVREAFSQVGFHDESLLERPAHHLSLGQRQAAALACVLSMKPNIIAYDEPTSALDPHARSHFAETVRGLAGTHVLVTQDLYLAAQLCSRLLLLDGGRAICSRPTSLLLADDELLTNHRLEFGLHARIVTWVNEMAKKLK